MAESDKKPDTKPKDPRPVMETKPKPTPSSTKKGSIQADTYPKSTPSGESTPKTPTPMTEPSSEKKVTQKPAIKDSKEKSISAQPTPAKLSSRSQEKTPGKINKPTSIKNSAEDKPLPPPPEVEVENTAEPTPPTPDVSVIDINSVEINDPPSLPADIITPETPVAVDQQTNIHPTETSPEAGAGETPLLVDFIADVGGRVTKIFKGPSQSQPSMPIQPPRTVEKRLAIIPPAPTVDRRPTLSKNENLAWIAGIGFLYFLIGVLVTLGILASINDGLHFASSRQASAIQTQLDKLNGDLQTVREETESLRVRMDAIETLSGRISSVEEQTLAMQGKLDKNNQDLTVLLEKMKLLNEQFGRLQERSQIFDNFLANLRSLLGEIPPVTQP